MQLRLSSFFPFVGWMRHYRKSWLSADIFAGLSIAFVALPQSIAFALIAGLPAQYGVYASVMPCIIGALFGSSAHLMNGPTNATALLILTTLAPVISDGYGIESVFLLAVLVGIIQLALGIARMGLVVDFISNAVLVGFTAGVAVQIIVQQIGNALGLSTSPHGLFYHVIWENIISWRQINWVAVGVMFIGLFVVLLLERYMRKWPSALVAMVVTTALVFLLGLKGWSVPVVGAIQGGIPPLTLPKIDGVLVQKLMPGATAIALLGLLNSLSISKSIALQSRQIINNNQEFIGQGLANLVAGFTSGFPVSGSFNRSMANFQVGAKTALSGIICGFAVALAALLLGSYAAYLPMSVIAGILFLTAWRMVNINQIKMNLMATKSDAAVLIGTFVGTLFLSLEFAVFMGIFLSIILFLMRTSHPELVPLLPPKPGARMEEDPEDKPCPQMGIVSVDGSLFFGSAQAVQADLNRYLENHPDMQNLLVRMHHVEVLDASGAAALDATLDKLKRRGGTLALAGVSRPNVQVLNNTGLTKKIGPDFVRKHTNAAMMHLMQTFSRKRCHACPYYHFNECKALKREGQKLEKGKL
ncbi:MAG: STAS domain-containing protein [Proteobacteria bacterium]|nr:STAS domain-containing protein [Pseudomonadota bacterium]